MASKAKPKPQPKPKYVCREEHAEDLTSLVEAAIAGADTGGIQIEKVAVKTNAGGVKTVVVTCSLGHQNVFEIEA